MKNVKKSKNGYDVKSLKMRLSLLKIMLFPVFEKNGFFSKNEV